MKILELTWEFPPFITGGLGMACYGLTKALLSEGVNVDLMLPTTDDVFFPLRHINDVDSMPMLFLGEKKEATKVFHEKVTSLKERLQAVGLPAYPGPYFTPSFNFREFIRRSMGYKSHDDGWRDSDWEVDRVMNYLTDQQGIFRRVQEFTAMVVQNAAHLDFDLIHAHDWLTYTAGILLKKMRKKPLVVHIHATEFDRAGGVGDERIHNIEYAGLASADRVIAVSQYTAQIVIDRYRIESRKIDIVHNAHNVDTLNTDKWKLFKDPLVLFMGRVTIQKGPDYFLHIAKRVIKEYPDVRFVLAGSGDMFSRILREAAALRLKDRFLCAGFLNRSQVERILAAADIFLLPSVSEPFGIAPLEAMAFGAATIISKQSGVAEVLKNVYKVDFWDIDKTTEIIVDLLKNKEKRLAMARAGQEEVLAIKWHMAAEKTVKVYRELLCSI